MGYDPERYGDVVKHTPGLRGHIIKGSAVQLGYGDLLQGHRSCCNAWKSVEFAFGSRQARRQRVGPHVSVDLNQNIEYIPEQPQWTGYRDPTPPSPPPSVDEYSSGQTQSVPSVPSGGTSSSRGSKRKAPMVDSIDSQFDKLTTSLDGFANVLSSSNVHFGVIFDAAVCQVSAMEDRNQILRRNPNYTYTEANIYEMLTSMNIADENLLDQCYNFLCGNPTCTKRLMGLSPHKRWNKLLKMISGGDC
ncbi:uncharacterized protein HKW66_Vig0244130 [Vigna angularis]|uniref:Uncharacterized protein n=1 Tax=Phaseolus angularis TaxID=3914 RepID=A0A8T0KYG6_PHAAN|nr:uncharacterized protein HKW66_Vig0244130 [Vigna angularis]